MTQEEYFAELRAVMTTAIESLKPQPESPEAERRRLRDMFAACAMQAYCGSPHADKVQEHVIADCAYSMADAMLARR